MISHADVGKDGNSSSSTDAKGKGKDNGATGNAKVDGADSHGNVDAKQGTATAVAVAGGEKGSGSHVQYKAEANATLAAGMDPTASVNTKASTDALVNPNGKDSPKDDQANKDTNKTGSSGTGSDSTKSGSSASGKDSSSSTPKPTDSNTKSSDSSSKPLGSNTSDSKTNTTQPPSNGSNNAQAAPS